MPGASVRLDMPRVATLLLTTLLVGVALAGCTGGDETPPTTTPETTPPATQDPVTTTPVTTTPDMTPSPFDSSTYTLEAAGLPAQVKPGQRVNFTLFVNGTLTSLSDHVGAHYADNDTTSPPAEGRRDCEHQAGDLPGLFTVACTFLDVGTWYVWGHARINDSGELRNWWTAAPTVVHVRNHTLVLSGVPTSPQASRANFTVNLSISGSENVTTDHVGAHYFNDSTNATTDTAAGDCQHVTGGAIANHTITCAIELDGVAPKEYFLRGHLRVTQGDVVLSWWSEPQRVTISPVGLGGLPGV